MTERHDRMPKEHSTLYTIHDFNEFLGLHRSEAGTRAFFTDWLGYAVGTAAHFQHDRGKERRAFWAEFFPWRGVMFFLAI